MAELQTYFGRYKELVQQYKITKSVTADVDNYDVVIERIGSGYGHTKYRVIKNKPMLPTLDLAIICDDGNLCFGYRTDDSIICVYTD